PYSLQFLISVVLMAAVRPLDAFRLPLIRPIFSSVLNPASRTEPIPVFRLPCGSHRIIDLHQFVPRHTHHVSSVVVIAVLGATIIKGGCDYLGSYLINYAGYGLTNDLRNTLYKKVTARSISFFSRYPTGTLISTIVNDIEKVQFALFPVMAGFL